MKIIMNDIITIITRINGCRFRADEVKPRPNRLAVLSVPPSPAPVVETGPNVPIHCRVKCCSRPIAIVLERKRDRETG